MGDRQAKRRKVENGNGGLQPANTIRTAEDLQNSLFFRQDSSSEVRQGIRVFKEFLTSISSCESTAEQVSKLRILKEYCDAQSPAEKYATSFPDLISTWSFAAEHKVDAILSAVPAVLAQFLKTISSHLEFRDFGISLCRTLLQRDQIRLIERGLNAPRGKDFVISPCLRLLTEVTGFDGGVVANELFSKRDPLFKRLDSLLDEAPKQEGEETTDRSRPTLRRLAQRVVLANLKFQNAAARVELILQGKILRACLRGIEDDGADIVQDILQAMEQQLLGDDKIPRITKGRFLDLGNLSSLCKLYSYEDLSSNITEPPDVRNLVHQFFLSNCTQPGKGLLVAQTGWYPAGITPDAQYHDSSKSGLVDLGMNSIAYFDDYKDSVPTKNGTLSAFAKSLRPEQDSLQGELLLRIFEAAPELVADYFSKKTKFHSAPKDTPEWRGEFAFLFSVIQLPVPKYCGWPGNFPATPPPLSIVIESILPRPLDRSTLTKCVNLNQELITMSAARVITVALHKLKDLLDSFSPVVDDNKLWSQASQKLVEIFMRRTPLLKDITTALQRVPRDSTMLRGAIVECLAAYFQIIPQSATTVKFDANKPLTDVLQSLNDDDLDEETRSTLVNQLPNYLTIAQQLPNTRWWQQSTPTSPSPITSILKLLTSSRTRSHIPRPLLRQIHTLLHTITTIKGILLPTSSTLTTFLNSLNPSQKWSPQLDTYNFIENAMSRIVQHPVRYLDMLEAHQRTVSDKKPLSLLTCCIAEQWPFVAKNPDKAARKNVAEWVARYFAASEGGAGRENFRVLAVLKEEMLSGDDERLRSVLQKAFMKQHDKPSVVVSIEEDEQEAAYQPQKEASKVTKETSPAEIDLNTVLGSISVSPSSIEGLDRWDNVDLESTIINGRMGRLLQCTASPEEEVRRQAYHTIQSLTQIIEASSLPSAPQLSLLLSELTQTTTTHCANLKHPLPSFMASLSAQLLPILHDPTDHIYSKANRFLLKSPTWDPDRIIGYWIDKLLLSEPEHDDTHPQERDLLLSLLQTGLRTPADLETYRRAGVWERVLALAGSGVCPAAARRRVLGILWRAMQIGTKNEDIGKGDEMGVGMGMGMLVRRAGVTGWLDVMRRRCRPGDEESRILAALTLQLERAADTDELKGWKSISMHRQEKANGT